MPEHVTEYFSDRADEYARYRPLYAADAIDWVVADVPPGASVVDVGSGTGIAARQLATRGFHTTGLEPNAAMRARAEAAGGGVTYVDGTAERTGLLEESFSLAVCAQCFHWFEAEPALCELHRILEPTGQLALIWNTRRADTPFMAVYEDVVRRAKAATRAAGKRKTSDFETPPPTHGGWFGGVRQQTFDNTERLDREQVLGRLDSASYMPHEGPVRDELLGELKAAFDEHADGEGTVAYSLETAVTLATRLER